jgi:acetylornithine deacetylase/succinyl-diaminopimelate desuccinylase family protein
MVDQQRLTELLGDLIQRESVNPALSNGHQGEAAVADIVSNFCEQLGLDVQQQEVFPGRPNVIARLTAPHGKGALMFEAHTDTVPAGEMVDAFTPRVVGDRLYGRGACDTKGSLAAMLHAIEQLARDPESLPCDVLLLAAVSEEDSLFGAEAFLELGIRPNAAIVGEPTDLGIIIAHKGVARFRLTTTGREGHTSTPITEDNAIYQAVEVVRSLRQYVETVLQQQDHPLVGPPALTVSRIHGGEVLNVVPGTCYLDVDRRTLPSEDPEQVMTEIEQYLVDLMARERWIQVARTQVFQAIWGMETPVDHMLVAVLQAACRTYELPSTPRGVPYGSDASMLAGKGGIPCVVFGPGRISEAHTREEWVSLSQVAQATNVLIDVARSFQA